MLGCAILLLISWIAALGADSNAQIQQELIGTAEAYMEDKIYVRAVPLLEDAASYNDKYTLEAEEMLKEAYLHLMDTSGYNRKYMNLLDKQMAREDASEKIYEEAAKYYLSISKQTDAFEILREGIAKTESDALRALYEENRYQYKLNRATYQKVTAIYNGAIQVMQDGFWGIASANGALVIPCEYDQISTYSNGRAVVKKGDVVSAVDADNNRVALYHGKASQIGNYGEDRLGLKTKEGWVLANGELNTAEMTVEEIAMSSGGYIPAKLNGKWGFLDQGGQSWAVEPQYDDIIRDELGRCCAQNALFVKKGEQVLLFVDGEQKGDVYEDAEPFADGWAAVKKGGKWGFIDTEGNVQIDFQFDQARSFGQHLAAVRVDRRWGYISLYGEMVIEAEFFEAKSFYEGSAPVKTADGWRFITLLEYK